MEDVNTVTGWLGFTEDYAKVMSRVDRYVYGDPGPMMEGGLTYAEIMEQLEGAKPGWPTVPMEYDLTLKRQWWKHVNPADIAFHAFVTYIGDPVFNPGKHGPRQFRYYGGLHWGEEEIGKLAGWYHYDLYDITYALPLNFLSHNLWEVWFKGYQEPISSFGRSFYPYVY